MKFCSGLQVPDDELTRYRTRSATPTSDTRRTNGCQEIREIPLLTDITR